MCVFLIDQAVGIQLSKADQLTFVDWDGHQWLYDAQTDTLTAPSGSITSNPIEFRFSSSGDSSYGTTHLVMNLVDSTGTPIPNGPGNTGTTTPNGSDNGSGSGTPTTGDSNTSVPTPVSGDSQPNTATDTGNVVPAQPTLTTDNGSAIPTPPRATDPVVRTMVDQGTASLKRVKRMKLTLYLK